MKQTCGLAACRVYLDCSDGLFAEGVTLRFNHMHNYTHVMDRMLNVWAFNYVAAGSVTYSIDGSGVKKTFLGPAVFVTQPGHHYFYGPAEAKGWDHTFFRGTGLKRIYGPKMVYCRLRNR